MSNFKPGDKVKYIGNPKDSILNLEFNKYYTIRWHSSLFKSLSLMEFHQCYYFSETKFIPYKGQLELF